MVLSEGSLIVVPARAISVQGGHLVLLLRELLRRRCGRRHYYSALLEGLSEHERRVVHLVVSSLNGNRLGFGGLDLLGRVIVVGRLLFFALIQILILTGLRLHLVVGLLRH